MTAVRSATSTIAIFTVIRTGSVRALNMATVVHFNTSSNSSAVNGVDFALPLRSVTFDPSSTVAEGVVLIKEHTGLDLKPKSFQIAISTVENGTLGADGRLLTVDIISSQSKLSVVHVCEGVA